MSVIEVPIVPVEQAPSLKLNVAHCATAGCAVVFRVDMPYWISWSALRCPFCTHHRLFGLSASLVEQDTLAIYQVIESNHPTRLEQVAAEEECWA